MVESQRKQPERPEEELEPQRQRAPAAEKGEETGKGEGQDRRQQEEDEETAAAEEQEEGRKDQGRALGEFETLYTNIEHVLHSGMHDIPQDLQGADQQAMELLFQAANGVDEYGLYASGLARMGFLNQALAELAPKLGAARRSDLAPLLEQKYAHLQEVIGELREEIKTKIKVEAHRGGRRRRVAKQLDDDRTALSELGQLCLDLSLLIKKRKRPELPYDPTEHPVITGLDALWDMLLALGKIGGEIARLDEKRTGASAARQADLNAVFAAAVERLTETLVATLERCREGAEAPNPGAFPEIARPLAKLAGKPPQPQGEAAARLALDFAQAAIAVLDGAEAAVAGGGDKKERGLLGRIFGRGQREKKGE